MNTSTRLYGVLFLASLLTHCGKGRSHDDTKPLPHADLDQKSAEKPQKPGTTQQEPATTQHEPQQEVPSSQQQPKPTEEPSPLPDQPLDFGLIATWSRTLDSGIEEHLNFYPSSKESDSTITKNSVVITHTVSDVATDMTIQPHRMQLKVKKIIQAPTGVDITIGQKAYCLYKVDETKLRVVCGKTDYPKTFEGTVLQFEKI